jgi:hypothetical protein
VRIGTYTTSIGVLLGILKDGLSRKPSEQETSIKPKSDD